MAKQPTSAPRSAGADQPSSDATGAATPARRRRGDKPITIVGTFVAHYTGWRLAANGNWVPQATIVEVRFQANGTVRGNIHLNPGGTELGVIGFKGDYALTQNDVLGTLTGSADFLLLADDGTTVVRRQELYIVRRNADEVFFMLGRSFVPASHQPGDVTQSGHIVFHQIDTKASVEGVFCRVT